VVILSRVGWAFRRVWLDGIISVDYTYKGQWARVRSIILGV
jgi:hypothetical protein